MKNLRDIEVKKRDKVYFEDEIVEVNGWESEFLNYKELEDYLDKIIKIERPIQYETIYETPKPILDKEEKEYLENVIRPFKDRVELIMKCSGYRHTKEYIAIRIQDDDDICLPYFDVGLMYKGMELCKSYTIKELGLFEGEKK